jgi:hypothetical protein
MNPKIKALVVTYYLPFGNYQLLLLIQERPREYAFQLGPERFPFRRCSTYSYGSCRIFAQYTFAPSRVDFQ